MAQILQFSEETRVILESEDASRKRSKLRARFREYLEARTGKTMQEWFHHLNIYDPHRGKSHYQLTKHLQVEFGLEIADANTIVSYYLNPGKRCELG